MFNEEAQCHTSCAQVLDFSTQSHFGDDWEGTMFS